MAKCVLSITMSALVLVVCSFSRATYEVAKPGCTDHCGDVKIPYPFDIGNSSCYSGTFSYDEFGMHFPYKIICDHTTNPPKPFIASGFRETYYEVLSINTDDHGIRLSFGVAFQCYTWEGPVPSTTQNNSYHVPSFWPFILSTTRNRLVGVGCDTTATFSDWSASVDELGRCSSTCQSSFEVKDGTCSDHGCCETSIYDATKLKIYVDSSENHRYCANFNPCSYAFVGEVGSYNFSTANLTASAKNFYKIRFSIVYDWFVQSSLNCKAARKFGNESFICGANATCIEIAGDFIHLGYQCQCLKGYAGNPYLSHGCQDIDECLDEKLNQCQRLEFCVNKKGGYDCQCPEGFHGSGTSNNPCVNNAPSRLANAPSRLANVVLG